MTFPQPRQTISRVFEASIPEVTKEMAARAEPLLPAAHPYPVSDLPLFIHGYALLTDLLDGKELRVLEVCCGDGGLLAELGRRFPRASFEGVDFRPEAAARAEKTAQGLPNVKIRCADAVDLRDYPDESFDLVLGQATLHHITNNLPLARREYARVLKKGGHCVFIFEPLGHNLAVAAIRAIRMARAEAVDESNVYFSLLRFFGEPFAETRVACFNLLGYAAKMLRCQSPGFFLRLTAFDRFWARRFPGLVRQCANFSVCYMK